MSKKNLNRIIVLVLAPVFLFLFWILLSLINVKYCPSVSDPSSCSFAGNHALYSLSEVMEESPVTEAELSMLGMDSGTNMLKLECEFSLPSSLFGEADSFLPQLYVPDVKSYVLLVNGSTHTAASGSEYIRCALADHLSAKELSTDHSFHFQVRIYCLLGADPSFSNNLLYLGNAATISGLISAGSFQRFFVIGVSFMILLYSLSLYSAKRSEKYLLFLALLAYTTTARTLWNALPALKELPLPNLLLFGTMPLPGVSGAVSYYVSYMTLKLVIAFMRYLLLKEFIPVRVGKVPYFWYSLGFFVLLLPFCISGQGYIASQSFILLTHLLELVFLVLGSAEQFSVCWSLTIVWCFTVALRVLDFFYSCGFAPHGMIEAGLKLQGIIETFFTLGFVIVINLKFGGKYREADELTASLEEINRNLEHIVEERTEDLRLRNEELSAAYHRLHEIQTQKDEFMTNIIHNLKTPLFSLYGYADMAMDEMEDAPELARKHLNEINKNTSYAKELIDNLFLCMRLEDGKVQYQPVPFPVSMLLAQLDSTSRARTEAAGIQLSVIPPAEELILTSDILYLRQALQNIIDNAVRHSESGTSLYVQAEQTIKQFDGDDEPRRWVCIRIKDQGEGIAPEEIPLIFGRYYSNGKKGASSSGLGLTITKEIIEQNGGHIEVESVLQEGTVFRVYLSLA